MPCQTRPHHFTYIHFYISQQFKQIKNKVLVKLSTHTHNQESVRNGQIVEWLYSLDCVYDIRTLKVRKLFVVQLVCIIVL